MRSAGVSPSNPSISASDVETFRVAVTKMPKLHRVRQLAQQRERGLPWVARADEQFTGTELCEFVEARFVFHGQAAAGGGFNSGGAGSSAFCGKPGA